MYHGPYVNLAELASFQPEGEIKELFEEVTENTCVRALLESGLFEFQSDGSLTLRLEQDTARHGGVPCVPQRILGR
jgi:hypothetical protein